MVSFVARLAGAAVAAAAIGAAVFYAVTRPLPVDETFLAGVAAPDLANGERLFWTGGCISCHAPKGASDRGDLTLSGGEPLVTPFGTFHPPNISPDETAGIGNWTLTAFASAMVRGVDDEGRHLYPSFPYGSYSRMTAQDLQDLFAYLKTLPKSTAIAAPHELGFPFNIRMVLGGWKFLYLDDRPRVALADADEQVRRGQYLVEGPGHCGECHTPRNALGGFQAGQWLAGGPNPEGQGRIPNITPGGEIGSWSVEDIASYLETGMTPEFDTVGGTMVEVQKNMARLPAEDRAAIAAYLTAIPAIK